MPAYDQKLFLDLLQEYKSDETKKARRNVSVIAFVIISAWILGIRLSDIRFLGLDISRTAELPVLALAGVLLIYWTFMFVIAYRRDKEIQKERAWFLNQELSNLRGRFKQIQDKYDEDKVRKGYPSDYGEVKAWLERYEAQRKRTQGATLFAKVIDYLETTVPLLLGAGAAGVLIFGAIAALRQ
jgi:hypothetical protein